MRTFIMRAGMIAAVAATVAMTPAKASDSTDKKRHPKKEAPRSIQITMICDGTIDLVNGKPVRYHVGNCQPVLEVKPQDDGAVPSMEGPTI